MTMNCSVAKLNRPSSAAFLFIIQFIEVSESVFKMQLYYVVYLEAAEKSIVVPCTWIKDSEIILKKFVHKSLNTSQSNLCYWSTRDNAVSPNGRPNIDFEPNFHATQQNGFPCIEGVYKCRILKFFSTYTSFISNNDVLGNLIVNSYS